MNNDPLHQAENFAQVFFHWGQTTPDALAFRYLAADDTSSSITYGALDCAARRIAAAMPKYGDRVGRGERALLLYEPGLAFIEAFVACLYAGVVPVPMFPPDPRRLERTLQTTRAIAGCADASMVLCSALIKQMLQPSLKDTAELAALPWLTTDTVSMPPNDNIDDNIDASGLGAPPALDAGPDELALLQFTSGSTTTPRGVMVSHGNLLHNERSIRRAFGHDQFAARVVGWLPTYHDMGLIGNVLQPAYLGVSTLLMSPMDFLQHPYRWLRAITQHRGTSSGGPNFAYELCTRRVTDEQLATLDLSSWRVAFCGAEPIDHGTQERFAKRFAPAGFRPEAFFPCYGLAEATLMVSGGWLGSSAQTHWLRTEALERHRAEPAAPDTIGSIPHVSCGIANEGQTVAIVDPVDCQTLPPGAIGEIWLQGPSVAAGYWHNPAATAEMFCGQLQGAEGGASGNWLRTGDLGVVRDGQLIVTGRRKDLLILHGRNLYPHDIEETVRSAHAGVYAGSVAAVSLPVGTPQFATEERLGLMVGLRRGDAGEVERAIRQAVAVNHGLSVHRLELVNPQDVPRTSSGKIRRAECRRRLLSIETGEISAAEISAPETSAPETSAPETSAPDSSASMYRPAAGNMPKLEARNTRYQFDLETDVCWDRIHEPGRYIPDKFLVQAGIDPQVLDRVPGLLSTYEWALAVALCEEFVVLEQCVLAFIRDERIAGRLPRTRSTALLDQEEVKHIALFRRYADHLKAQRPDLAAALDRHLQRSFDSAWWHQYRSDFYPSAAVFHFVSWLQFVYFEEYSIFVCELLRDNNDNVQPAWLKAHIVHKQEERQHVLTDAAHLDSLILGDAERRQWSRWFLEQNANYPAGLPGLGGVWNFVLAHFPEAADLPQPQALVDHDDIKRRAFLRLITTNQVFARTVGFATGLADFAAACQPPLQQSAAAETAGVAPQPHTAQRIRAYLVHAIAETLNMPPEGVNTTQPLIYFGIDSVAAVRISSELEALLDRKLAPTILFEYPSIDAISEALAASDAVAASDALAASDAVATSDAVAAPAALAASTRADSHSDAVLDPDIFETAEPAEPQHVLVTGATGFLCGFLLAELLRSTPHRATCLVRAPSPEAGLERVRANLRAYGVWDDGFADRIAIVVGDLEQPRFGLSQAAFSALAHQLDSIFHGGAIVDFIQPYARLRAANVQGTHEVIRLAFVGGNVPLNFISTIAVFDTRDQNGSQRHTETDVPNARAGFRNGYGESKWIAEQLVTQAGARGLPFRVFRPGIVSGDSERGAWQPDLAATLLKTYAVQGTAISTAKQGVLDAAPVDYVARALLHIALAPTSLGGIYHLTNPQPTPWSEIYAAMARIGHPVRPLPYMEWMDTVAADEGSLALRPFLAYFRARRQMWQLRQPRMDCTQTLAVLDGSGIVCPRLDDGLLTTYLHYLLDDADQGSCRP